MRFIMSMHEMAVTVATRDVRFEGLDMCWDRIGVKVVISVLLSQSVLVQ